MLLVALAWGYSLTGSDWSWQDHPIEDPFWLNPSSWPSDVGTEAEIEDAVEKAMGQWNAVPSDAVLNYGGLTAKSPGATYDGLFYIHYTTAYDAGAALAFAGTWTWEDGTAYDCDVMFLGKNSYGTVSWDADPAGAASGRYDIYGTALHELGHCLGLDHSSDSGAVMYAYYNGVTTLTSDDKQGLKAIHGSVDCVDGDGDGYSDCDADCDDDNALVNPGVAEVCNGADDNCDGLVDADTEAALAFGADSKKYNTDWLSTGNAYRVESPTQLRKVRAHLSGPEGSRLSWQVWVSDEGKAPWTVVRTEYGLMTADGWQESPVMDLPLEVGKTYAIAVGALSGTLKFFYETSPSFATQGPLTPLGQLYSKATGDEFGEADADYLWDQEITVLEPADPDGDGLTAQCGDCDPEDPDVYEGAPELCDGVDQDCDEQIDEDFPEDADADGVIDCLDPCPEDALDDRDGDGACDGDDLCPDDPANDNDGDGLCDGEDPCPLDPTEDVDGDGLCGDDDACPEDADNQCRSGGAGGDCGCGGNAVAGPWVLAALALALRRRGSPLGG